MSETIIKVTCTDCGDVNIRPEDIVELVRNKERNPGIFGFYTFNCFICSNTRKQDIKDPRVFNFLAAVGVDETGLPPITEEEIEEFVQELGYESYLAQIVELEK